MRMIARGAGFSLMAVLMLGVFGARTVAAQIYPSPDGYCVVSLSAPSPPLDSTVTLLVTAADRAGNRLSGISGTAEIIEQPGNQARLVEGAFTTGPDGTATLQLFTGEAPGLIRVFAVCDDVEVTSNLVVGPPPGPPPTGAIPVEDEGGGAGLGIAGGLAAMAMIGALLGTRLVNSRR